MPPESESDTLTAESIAVQIIQGNAELARQYASGDLGTLGVLQEKAVKLGRAGQRTLGQGTSLAQTQR